MGKLIDSSSILFTKTKKSSKNSLLIKLKFTKNAFSPIKHISLFSYLIQIKIAETAISIPLKSATATLDANETVLKLFSVIPTI